MPLVVQALLPVRSCLSRKCRKLEALSPLGERVAHDGAFISRRGTGEEVVTVTTIRLIWPGKSKAPRSNFLRAGRESHFVATGTLGSRWSGRYWRRSHHRFLKYLVREA